MKKLCALLLCLCLMLSMVACGSTDTGTQKDEEKEKTKDVYLVTSQKSYFEGKLQSSAEFTYDDKGRPLTIEIQMGESRAIKSELTYDSHGNKIREVYTHTDRSLTSVTEEDYDMTYTDGKLTHCTITSSLGSVEPSMGFDLQYDEKGRLVRVDYDEAYSKQRLDVWHAYEYDIQGRLIKETRCRKTPIWISQDSLIYEYLVTQLRYQYGEERSVFVTLYSGRSTNPITPDALSGLELEPLPEQYNYCFDKTGQLIYVGTDENDVYKEEYGTLKDDERYTFGENGNMLAYDSGESRTEYTYTKVKLTEKEAEMAKRLHHGISGKTSQYAMFGKMDPIYVDIAPLFFYSPYLQSPVYYLVPCPLWYMPKK